MQVLFITSTRIGDAVLSSGLLDALLLRHPNARLTIACGPLAAPLFAEVPGLERLHVVRKKPGHRHWLELWRATVGRRWDLVIDLRRSGLAYFLRAGERRRLPQASGPIHRVTLLGRVLGLDPPPAPRLWTNLDHEAAARALAPDDKPLLVTAPTANWLGKTWPAERFAALAERLLPGARVLVCCGPGEGSQAMPVLEGLDEGRGRLVEGEALLTLYALFARARLFVGNDSGLMHLAAAAGAPTLGLFGPSPDALYAPWGPNCAVVRTPESMEQLIGTPGFDYDTTGSLMTGLTVDTVEQAAKALLARTESPP
ncbi:MAG: glycosyltransferase family 9 protein [Pseudomonadota bacterium]